MSTIIPLSQGSNSGAKRSSTMVHPTVAKRLRRVEYLTARNKAEMKMQDFNVSGAVTDGSIASVMELTAIAEGSGANERHGNKIRIHRAPIVTGKH